MFLNFNIKKHKDILHICGNYRWARRLAQGTGQKRRTARCATHWKD